MREDFECPRGRTDAESKAARTSPPTDVIHYSFDLAEGAVMFAPDESCPYICVEHALANERGARGAKLPDAVADYPYTNRSRLPGISIYRQLDPAYVA